MRKSFQKTGMGRLKFSQFKDLMFSLKSWQSTFKNHTKEKTGILKAERLRDCLGDVGKFSHVIFLQTTRYIKFLDFCTCGFVFFRENS